MAAITSLLTSIIESQRNPYSMGFLSVLGRMLRWQFATRIWGGELAFELVSGTRMIARRGLSNATSQYYLGLAEVSASPFLLHYLRPSDLFVDVGANIGLYTILAAGACGAHAIAFEPSTDNFAWLERNIALNNLGGLAELHRAAVGDRAGEVRLEVGHGTTNHISSDAAGTEAVPCVTLDEAVPGRVAMIKIDVMGYEPFVLEGASHHLQDPTLEAVIVGTCRHAPRFGRPAAVSADILMRHGFKPASYDAVRRELLLLDAVDPKQEALFVRPGESVTQRLATAPRFTVLQKSF